MATMSAWKTDNYKFVGKAFDYAYANRMNKLSSIFGERVTNSIDYEITGLGGYGELSEYNGTDLTFGTMKRGFKTIVTPKEYSKAIDIGYKQAKNDKSGVCRRVGSDLGNSAAMSVYMNMIRTLGGAFNPNGQKGGDGKIWAASDHPVASKSNDGRNSYVADPDAGTFSNVIATDLSVSAITTAQATANRFVTPDGMPFLCEMDTLLVSPELEATAKKMLGENAKLYPDSDSNVNPIYGEMKYIVVGGGADGFTSKQWAICDRKLMKEVFLLVYNTKPMVMQDKLDNPLIDRHVAYVDYAIGWGDARQIIFSTGA